MHQRWPQIDSIGEEESAAEAAQDREIGKAQEIVLSLMRKASMNQLKRQQQAQEQQRQGLGLQPPEHFNQGLQEVLAQARRTSPRATVDLTDIVNGGVDRNRNSLTPRLALSPKLMSPSELLPSTPLQLLPPTPQHFGGHARPLSPASELARDLMIGDGDLVHNGQSLSSPSPIMHNGQLSSPAGLPSIPGIPSPHIQQLNSPWGVTRVQEQASFLDLPPATLIQVQQFEGAADSTSPSPKSPKNVQLV
jgi:hypothetical protein